MEMKNKLFHHHKSKASIVMRDFSIVVASVSVFVLALTIPTYLSIHSTDKSQMQASEVEVEEEPVDESENPDVSGDELISYN